MQRKLKSLFFTLFVSMLLLLLLQLQLSLLFFVSLFVCFLVNVYLAELYCNISRHMIVYISVEKLCFQLKTVLM